MRVFDQDLSRAACESALARGRRLFAHLLAKRRRLGTRQIGFFRRCDAGDSLDVDADITFMARSRANHDGLEPHSTGSVAVQGEAIVLRHER